jgi:SH3 domain protein
MRIIYLSCVLLLLPTLAMSEVVYITDQLKAGLHEDKSLASPIVKIVATGTRLEIIKRDEQLSFVKDSSGTSGWINNQYLMAKAPDNTDLKTLQIRADNLEQRLVESKQKNLSLEAKLKSQGKVLPEETLAYTKLKKNHAELEQQFKAEKLKVGKSQIEVTELRNRLGQDNDADALYGQVKTLEEDKKKLEIKLANLLDTYEAQGGAGLKKGGRFAGAGEDFNPGTRNIIIYLLITLVLGLFGGAYLMDLLNRRRHGGFRI